MSWMGQGAIFKVAKMVEDPRWGPSLAACVLLAPPLAFGLSGVIPALLRLAVVDMGYLGRRTGSMIALSTVGSLAGTWGTHPAAGSAQADRQPLTLMATAKKRPETYPGQYKAQTSLIYATSSSEAALAEKYSQCLRETPNTKCSNIPLYDEAGFKLEKNGFHYSGRWYVYDVEKHTPFYRGIKIQFDQTARWKFASDQVRILNTTPDTEKTARFDRFPLHFSYQVPLDTPVLGVNNATGSKSTTLTGR